jgi:polar amino acid transport system permease protein
MNSETLSFLITWTPFLLQGFMWNIFIAICAVTLGSLLGAGLAWLRVRKSGAIATAAEQLSTFFRGVPTLALIFYAVFVPDRVLAGSTVIHIHVEQGGDRAGRAAVVHVGKPGGGLPRLAARRHRRALLFIPTDQCVPDFLCRFQRLVTAGVSELVSRCNTVIAATGTSVMVPVYLYCSLYFVLTSLLFTFLIRRFKDSAFMAGVHARLTQQTCRN